VSGQPHVPAALTPGERAPGTHWIGGWVGIRDCLDDKEKWKFFTLPGLQLGPLGRPPVASLYTDYATAALLNT
jgi:hypothetical protein